MKFHEKSLELNITHEILGLADSWYWFLSEIPLWRYWRPRYRLPFLKHPRSTAGGFHITSEGKSDPTGEQGGGFDVRIKAGLGGHLLFIQYKLGERISTSPDPKSIFNSAPHEHFKFKINSTSTNQHFLLRDLADGIGKAKGNAIVYALPLIADMAELEAFAGKLIRKTKFVSIADIDAQATLNGVTIAKNVEHSFRVGVDDMNRCEMNLLFFFFAGKDRAPEIIADVIALSFQKHLVYYVEEIEKNYKRYDLYHGYIAEGLQRAFGQYLRYLLHFFEVSPTALDQQNRLLFAQFSSIEDTVEEFAGYPNDKRDMEIITRCFNALSAFRDYIANPVKTKGKEVVVDREVPKYQPSIFVETQGENGYRLVVSPEYSEEDIGNVCYLVI